MFRLVERLWAQRISTAYRVCSRCVRWTHRRAQTVVRTSPWSSLTGPTVVALSMPFLRGKTPEEELKEAWALGLHYIHIGELALAEERLHVVLKFIVEQFERGEITQKEFQGKRARVTSEMANLSLLTGNLEKAEKLVVATMQDCIACGLDPRGPELVEMSLKLAQIMAAGSRSTEADTGFRFCVESMQESVKASEAGDEDELKNVRALLGICATAYAKFLQKEGRYQDALKMILLALGEARKIYDEVNPIVVTLMGDEAVLLGELGEYKASEKSFWAAIEIAEFRPDVLLEQLPPLYINLGSILLRTNRLKDSEDMALTAQRLLKDMPLSRANEEAKEEATALLAKLKAVKEENLKKNS